MKSYIHHYGLWPLLALLLMLSCKKKTTEPKEIDIMQHYIAGKFSYQQGPGLPFAIIPATADKATFVWVSEKRVVDYTWQNHKFSTKINGADFSCEIKNGKVENIVVTSSTLSIPIAALNKKEDAALALAGKRYEAPMKKLDGTTVVFNNYYFRFNTDAGQFNYISNPTPGSYLITTKIYEKLAEGCLYNEQTKTFGVILNGKLEIETKIAADYLLFSGTKL